MQYLRNTANIIRFVLIWFALSLGVAIASPMVQPKAMDMVCTSTGMQSLASPDAPADTSGNMAPMACGFCVVHAQLACDLPTPQVPAWAPLTSAPPELQAVSQHLPSVQWSPGLARAPPSLL